jgi:hypothetical protein
MLFWAIERVTVRVTRMRRETTLFIRDEYCFLGFSFLQKAVHRLYVGMAVSRFIGVLHGDLPGADPSIPEKYEKNLFIDLCC